MNWNTPSPVEHIPSSPPFDFVFGYFNLSSNWAVPYFTTTMSIREAADSLKLVSQFPGYENMAWRIDDLYQRDIDWERVEKDIAPYLANTQEPQFFNSLTIALMPIKDNETQASFQSASWAPPELKGNFAKRLNVGPISLGYYNNWDAPTEPAARLGRISWNPQQVFSVAIDGQHRLAALKEAARGGYDDRSNNSRVPVILLLLDERVGYRAPKGTKLLDLMRTIFVALNKHSKQVSRPRHILLDDQDPHALCVRAMIGDQITAGLDDLKLQRLPLSLVDWHREQAKIDDGPYLTTILGLDWIVEQALHTKATKDYFNYQAVEKQLRTMAFYLGLDINDKQSSTRRRLDKLAEFAVEPFSFTGSWSHSESDGELGQIVNAFRATWAKGIIHLLTEFAPYKSLIQRRQDDKSFSTEFVNWYYLLERSAQGGKKAKDELEGFISRLKVRGDDSISEMTLERNLQSIIDSKGQSLAFKVAFQRSLVAAYIEFVAIDEQDLSDFDEDSLDEDENENENENNSIDNTDEEYGSAEKAHTSLKAELFLTRAKQFVDGLNQVITNQPIFMDVRASFDTTHLWHGSLYKKSDNTIDFTLGASKRAKDLIFIAACLALCKDQKDEAISKGFKKFWEELPESDVGIHRKIWRSVQKKFCKLDGGTASRILAERDDEFNMDEALEEAEKRVKWLWEALKMPAPAADKPKQKKSK
jgi:hypothetical protein